ncbi:phosphoribosylanthranilate isomerase [Bacillus sp. FJAT-49736]|uniref:phosphoribosylanthranilate isomerase n=1 Tax=Bacillus sp. FJAT-49736 TaxID=2833582 RepID=UPI001BCA534C|nr:phosphoribosylanthranilate isomerase [Bacillus sp. FJAT-49736]MBS4175153.1 phosphoribosylanthranilate isomerase [Bacillus sp. FJAT-49736]
MAVKICGIKTFAAAKAAADSGADFIGFVFADSKRRISPEHAKEIVNKMPGHIKIAGVFVNEEKSVIQDIADYVGLHYIQLHGKESPEFTRNLVYPTIKGFSIHSFEKIKEYDCDYYLVDSPNAGSGRKFDWNTLENVDFPKERLILAGGLSAENVRKAIFTVKPAVVDVSSGVETLDEKDPKKIKEFIQNAQYGFREIKERG